METLGETLDDPQAAHFRINHATAVFAAVQAVVRLGVLDLLDGPSSLADLAQKTGADADGLARVLAFLAAEGVLVMDAEGTVTPTARTVALRNLVPAINNDRLTVEASLDLNRALVERLPAFELCFGQPAFEYLRDHPAISDNFAKLMRLTTQQGEASIFARHTFQPFAKAVDVGGNRGSLLLHLLSQHASANGVLYDRPEAAEVARSEIDTTELADRVETIGGDFFAEVPPGGDLYLLKQILHDWGDEACITILRNIRRAMAPAGRLAVIERVIPDGPGSHNARDVDLLMLVWTDGGRERTVEEYAALLQRGGFALDRVTDSERGLWVIEAVPV